MADTYFVLQQSMIDVPNIPLDASKGTHQVPFGRTIYIERTDFREVGRKLMKRSGIWYTVQLRGMRTSKRVPNSFRTHDERVRIKVWTRSRTSSVNTFTAFTSAEHICFCLAFLCFGVFYCSHETKQRFGFTMLSGNRDIEPLELNEFTLRSEHVSMFACLWDALYVEFLICCCQRRI